MPRLIMIDDNPLEHLIVRKMLEKQQCFINTSHFYDGRAVISLIRKQQLQPQELPDLILLDLHMPGYSGWNFLDDLIDCSLSLSKTPDVVILTSSVDATDQSKAACYPFVKAFYSKPLRSERLTALYKLYQPDEDKAC